MGNGHYCSTRVCNKAAPNEVYWLKQPRPLAEEKNYNKYQSEKSKLEIAQEGWPFDLA